MVYGLVRLTAPALEPVTVEEAKAHLRVDGNDEDAYISSLISIARTHIENLTGRALLTQTFRLSFDRWPEKARAVELPRAPLQSVTSIKIFNADGDPLTIDSAEYEVDSATGCGRIFSISATGWPEPERHLHGIEITFTAGYGDLRSDVPAEFRHSLLLLVAHWFEHREASDLSGLSDLPLGVSVLLAPHRTVRL